LLILRGSDSGGNDRGASAGCTDASTRCLSASTVSHTAAAGDSSASSSNASSAMAIGGDSVVSGFRATAACAALHAHTGSAFAVRLIPDAGIPFAVRLIPDACSTVRRVRGAFSGVAACRIALCLVACGCTSSAVWVCASETGACVSPIADTAASGARHAAGSGAASARRIVNGQRCYRLGRARRAASNQPVPGA
jgi:hypothetical protein